ncbi:MAG TPA: hypothetical protein VK151_14475 [Fluviicola sp.]|nr:hypothetical protein [Fluviicola sp.]
MRKITVLLTTLLCSMSVFSQEDAAIRQWQSAHPTTLLISKARYASFSEEEKALIGTDYILFDDKVTLELLEQSEQSKSVGMSAKKPVKEEDQQLIKDWMGTHREVKIIRQSAFAAFSPERQQYCLERPLEILILEGESITLKDIEGYGN